MQLSEIIREKIGRNGPMAFRDFMEMALYYPQLGYYTSDRNKIGAAGDYYTNTDLSAVFGAMIGRQLEEMWELTGQGTFTIVEYGAGTGALCHDLLDYLESNPPFYDRLKYCIIEKSPFMREREKVRLGERVGWYDTIADIGKFTGCVLSNELLDNFSVHEVVMEDELMEVFVDYRDGFFELLQPAPEALKDYLKQLQVTLPKGFRTEINLQAIDWICDIAQSLERGFVLTIDYGYPSAELYRECRCGGTLMCYHRHQVNDDPYHHIGEQDITAHVNFSALNYWGLKNGLECCGFTEQGYFLRSLGLMDYLNTIERSANAGFFASPGKAIAIHNLLNGIGSKLKVLIQRKGPMPKQLTGLALAGTVV
ncbi:class I SAM-dependent methyltransferase [Chitinophaga japonensis]|uniref:SAM-dependent MidA family methyltransferase n=1 Tax=Chitinophaga japonensis TaxID=104662 RepID=A0A562T6T7_CHIJA|nr:SAM-dependent methyltransferase [Chitinophaga japonensis]TWI88964.1 SAM-dependent MidA family methyltransferase [Chitinophaga japonensis]